MSAPFQRIQGHERVLDAFGYWPAFHDAEVLSLSMDRNCILFDDIAECRIDLCLHAFEWCRAARPTLNHHLVRFRFHEVSEVVLEDFNHQNAIFELKIENYVRGPDLPVGLRLTLLPAYGLSGSFCAADVQVLLLVPCDERGKPRSVAEPPAAPNGSLATPVGNSEVTEGPPSVS